MVSSYDLLALLYHVTIKLWENRNVEKHGENEEAMETEAHIGSIRKRQVPLLLSFNNRQRRKE